MLSLQQKVCVVVPGQKEELPGKIIGRIFCVPPRYDVMLDTGELANNLPEVAVRQLEKV